MYFEPPCDKIENNSIEFLKERYSGIKNPPKTNWKMLIERFSTAQNHLEKLANKNEFNKLLAIYESRYVVYSWLLKEKSSGRYMLEFYTKDLFTKTFEKVTHADLEHDSNKLEIVNLDTKEKYGRIGHGKIMLKCIEKYSIDSGIYYIYGRYYPNTPIGLDNLIRFYKNNGYEDIDGIHFKKFLK